MAAAQAEEAEVQYEEEEEQGGGGSTLITEVSEGRWQSALRKCFPFLSLSFFTSFLSSTQNSIIQSFNHVA